MSVLSSIKLHDLAQMQGDATWLENSFRSRMWFEMHRRRDEVLLQILWYKVTFGHKWAIRIAEAIIGPCPKEICGG